MADIVYDLTISGRIPIDFMPYPSTQSLNLTIAKFYTSNDSRIGQTDNLLISLGGTGPYEYSFSHLDSELLKELDDEQYIVFTYRVTTPGQTATYLFDPFEVLIGKAEVWRFHWE